MRGGRPLPAAARTREVERKPKSDGTEERERQVAGLAGRPDARSHRYKCREHNKTRRVRAAREAKGGRKKAGRKRGIRRRQMKYRVWGKAKKQARLKKGAESMERKCVRWGKS